jgi:hypothetical protein
MRRCIVLAAAAALAMLVLAPSASAATVSCGDTITETTVLDSDVVCPDDVYSDFGAVRIGADNITLWMNGHTIRAGAAGGAYGVYGVTSSEHPEPWSGVQIRGGSIEGFDGGIELPQAQNSSVLGMTVTARFGGIGFGGVNDYACCNTVDITEGAGQSRSGIAFGGPGTANAYAWGNTVTGSAQEGIFAVGDNSRIVLNRVAGDSRDACSTGIAVNGYVNLGVVSINQVSGCNTGISVQPANGVPGNGKVRRNMVTATCFGIVVNDPNAVIWNNNASGNTACEFGTGIQSQAAGTFIKHNTANNNTSIGINAAAGTVDGGENVATGNGGANCINVTCSSGGG